MTRTRNAKRRLVFSPLSAGTMANECFICRTQPDVFPRSALVLPDAVKITCNTCLRRVPQSAMNVPEPEAKLWCPVCGMKTIVVGTDAVVYFPTSKPVDYLIGPYGAVCSRCITFTRAIHPSPEAALAYWRDYPEAVAKPH